ncbi:hypothetical protein [Collinsella sp. An2]|uniref:hypothetical protein n=1 Tax=Collinsella sp. An2 TaxID=1965585 RepID=UPI000B376EFC|nr:hypothetical protein [Collinsella sp. An2]OUP06023.1 hypothetical protein B5F33_10570 [Collinsella sp. An2]
MDILSAKEAAAKALEYVSELSPEAKYIALEGIELSPDQDAWLVIVGYVMASDIPQMALVAANVDMRSRRTYKRLILDAHTLDLRKMEPYEIAA